VTSARASSTVSTTTGSGHVKPVAAQAALRKPTSKRALCATITAPAANSRNAGSAERIEGAEANIASVMPVRTRTTAGIGTCELTNVWNSPSTSPPRTFTAPISVMWSWPALPPVVSRSTTTKVTSCRGVPTSGSGSCRAVGFCRVVIGIPKTV
jgi:hypothetical protein